MADWRVARSLGRLRTQINDRFPGRSKLADGTIGDAAHRARGNKSDHNPWIRLGNLGIVSALDLTHDPRKGCDTYALFEHLARTRDYRIKYAISQRRWFSSITQPWIIRPYSQTPHTGHIHVSCSADPKRFDLVHDWDIGWGAPVDTSPDPERDVLRRGSTGDDVRLLQGLLGTGIDGVFGPLTETAVRAFQASIPIRVDGWVGPQTWEHLEFLETIPE